MRRRLVLLCASCVMLAVSVATTRPVAAAWEKSWEKCSGFDSSDRSTASGYDLDYICATQFSDRVDKITFFLFFRQYITRYQFNNSYGSWAAAVIDTNFDGEWDMYIRTDRATLPTDSSTVAGRSVNARYESIGCPAIVWSNIAGSAKWIGIEVSKSCLGLPAGGFNIQGYADSEFWTDDGFDWAPESAMFITPPVNSSPPTTTTTTTTTTLPPVQVPNAPASLSVSKVSDSSLRVTWIDNSSNEEGFLVQRDDIPVPAGTTVTAWPYRVSPGVVSWDATGLAIGKRYCFTVASFNSAGVSRFADWACMDLAATVAGTTAPSTAAGLSCDATRGRVKGSKITVDVMGSSLNAGRRLSFEVFVGGKWVRIGSARVLASGAASISAPVGVVQKSGALPMRATQGSRFICEGTLS